MTDEMDTDDAISQPLPPLVKSASRTSLDESISWYHGNIDRETAESVLSEGGNKEGLFLVRESTSSPGDYVLSLIYNDSPIHYQIRRHGEDAFFSIDDGPVFHGLEMLISYYQEQEKDLSASLTHMCRGNPPPPDTRRHGRTNLLHRATKEGEVNVVRELLKSGYHNLDAKNQEGQTALHLASILGSDDIVELLLVNGANSNLLDGSGHAPLHVLLHCNIPCYPRSNYNETPLDLALKNDHQECISLIKNVLSLPAHSVTSEWFHEQLDREGTAKVFAKRGYEDGMFLIRRSSRSKDMYVLAVVCNGHIYSYEIQRKDSFYFIDDGPYLQSLNHIVDHYTRMADGLPTNLVHPIPQEKRVSYSNSPGIYSNSPPLVTDCTYTNLSNELPSKNKDLQVQPVPNLCSPRPNLISRESLVLGNIIGEGEFGSVLKGIWHNADRVEIEVAIKTVREDHLDNNKEGFIREVEVMIGLNHKCIVQLLGVCLGPPLMMIQELVPMGSLLDYLLDFPNEFNMNDMILWGAQISWGMTYLESKGFVHRDLAARNILLSTKSLAKIGDFGFSRALGGNEYYRATSGGRWPVKWYAPESINYGTFSNASDVWSYGVTLWEIFTNGEPPYGEMTGTEVLELLEANQRLSIPKTCPDKIRHLIQRCWLYSPRRRPTFRQILDKFRTDQEYYFIWEMLTE